MNSPGQQRQDAMRTGAEARAQYHSMLDGWAEVSKCCLAAADDFYQTGIDYMKEQVDQLHEISCDPSAAMREQTVSKALNCGFDAADRIAQAYMHSLENVRAPLMRAMSAQLPMGRTMSAFMQQGMEAMEQGTERMRGAVRTAERNVQEAHPQQGKRKSA